MYRRYCTRVEAGSDFRDAAGVKFLDTLARLVDSPENRAKLRVPPGISDIRVENGELFVVYR